MTYHLSELVVHATVTALVIEGLRRSWGLECARDRLVLRGLALALPLVALPCFELVAPFRHDPWFDGRALLTIRRWEQVKLAALPVSDLGLAAMAALALTLLARDLYAALRAVGAPPPVAATSDGDDALRAIADGSPGLRLIQLQEPGLVLYARGARAPAVFVSRAVTQRLDARELLAAVAHERAHIALGDLWVGWLLLLLRGLGAVSPATQLVGRALLQDLELRADERAAAQTSDPLSLASALLKLHRERWRASSARWGAGRASDHLIERRCRRLLAWPPRGEPTLRAWQVAGATLGCVSLLFLVN